MSIANNNIVRSVMPKSKFESAFPVLSSAVTYNQGDILAFDTGSHILKPYAVSGDAANILGVARQTIVSGVAKSPYQGTAVDASVGISDVGGPVYGVVASFLLTTGDSLNPGDKVYPSTSDPQTVTSTNGTGGKNLGMFQGRAITSAASGTYVDVLVGSWYGNSDIEY